MLLEKGVRSVPTAFKFQFQPQNTFATLAANGDRSEVPVDDSSLIALSHRETYEASCLNLKVSCAFEKGLRVLWAVASPDSAVEHQLIA